MSLGFSRSNLFFSALVQGFEDLIKLVKELTDPHTEMNDGCM